MKPYRLLICEVEALIRSMGAQPVAHQLDALVDGLFHLGDQVTSRYPEALASAEKVRHHIDAQYGKQISNEEVAYLALHIQRLATP